MITPKEEFMQVAINEANRVSETGDHAVGAVIVQDGKIIARSPMRTRKDEDATQHPEMAVIRNASQVLNRRHLSDCIMYITHEPCPMCATAAVWSRLGGVVIGARMSDTDEFRSTNSADNNYSWRTVAIPAREIFSKGDPEIEMVVDFMRNECKTLFYSAER